MRRLEPWVHAAVLLALVLALAVEGRARADLERRVAVSAPELYRTLARSATAWQVVDVRPDLVDYDDAHVPGALPLPGCDPAQAPAAARERILPSVPTVIVSETGREEEAAACLARFGAARLLAGGMEAWSDANLPEDVGEYTPPSSRAGGGCL